MPVVASRLSMSMRAWLSLFERTPGSVLPEVEKVPPMTTEVTSAERESEVSGSRTAMEPLAEMAAPVSVRSAVTTLSVMTGASLVPVMVMVTVWAGSEVLLA